MYQINHCAGTFHLGRKDRLWGHIQRAAQTFGLKEFDIMPRTYILPRELSLLKLYMKHTGEQKARIILKPVTHVHLIPQCL